MLNYHIPPEEIAAIFDGLEHATRVVPMTEIPLPVRDPKDVHILATALGGDADYLVTGDHDLLVLRGDPRLGRLQIVTAAEFLAILDQPAANGDAR